MSDLDDLAATDRLIASTEDLLHRQVGVVEELAETGMETSEAEWQLANLLCTLNTMHARRRRIVDRLRPEQAAALR